VLEFAELGLWEGGCVNVDSDTINHVSLCSGYGGIDLGLKRAIGRSLRTVAFVEIEAFAAANLAAKAEAGLLDNAPIWSDLKRFPWGKFHGLVDILSGGYPCQPFSAAGKRLGAEDPRHLWPFISAGIALMRPAVCFFENVEGHISLGLRDVLQDLVGLGYRATWCVASASECGAPHQRKRVFILAERNNEGPSLAGIIARLRTADAFHDAGEELADSKNERLGCWSPERWEGQDRQERREVWHQPFGQGHCGTELADSQCAGLEGQHNRNTPAESPEHVGADAWASGECSAWPSRPGEQQFAWEPPRVCNAIESKMGRGFARTTHRLDDAELYTTCDNRTDELRLLGNGVVPACAERAFRLLVGELRKGAN
jgi:DNA (cytosine-5)-methyltransferase 1